MALLGLILVVAIMSHVWWLQANHSPPSGDAAYHVAQEAAYRTVLWSRGPLVEKVPALLAWPGGYPPGVYAWTALFRAPSRMGDDPAIRAFIAYILLLGSATYLLGRRLAGPAGGAAAAAVVLSDSSLLMLEHGYFLDMPATAMIVAALCVLVSTEGFSRPIPSLILGGVVGVGMLTKPTFSWFLAAPIVGLALAPLWRWVKGVPARSRAVFFLVAAGAPLMFVVLGRWRYSVYLTQEHPGTLISIQEFAPALAWLGFLAVAAFLCLQYLDGVGDNFLRCHIVAGALCGPWLITDSPYTNLRWTAYLVDARRNFEGVGVTLGRFGEQVPVPVLLLALAGALALFFHRDRRPVVGAILLALVPGAAWTLGSLAYTYRYAIPVNALLGLLTVAWIPRWRNLPWLLLPLYLAWGGVNLLGPHLMDYTAPWYPAFARISKVTLRERADDLQSDPVGTEGKALAVVSALPGSVRTLAVVQTAEGEEENVNFADLQMLINAWVHHRGLAVLVEAVRLENGNLTRCKYEVRGLERELMLARWRGESGEAYAASVETSPDAVLVAGTAPEDLVARQFSGSYALAPSPCSGFRLYLRQGEAPRTDEPAPAP